MRCIIRLKKHKKKILNQMSFGMGQSQWFDPKGKQKRKSQNQP